MVTEIEEGFVTVTAFSEIKDIYEKVFEKENIKTLYKIRNWRERYHPEFLGKGEIYFTPPLELNDPFDITRPVKFDTSIIENSEFFQRLVKGATELFGINPGYDAEIFAKKKLDEIRLDPNSYFLKNYEDYVNSENYNNSVGVFSVTTNPCDEQLWGYYGGGLKGFAIGFGPIALCEELFSRGALIDYTDEIRISKIINKSLKENAMSFFQKNEKWKFESEFRFVRMIDPEQKRRKHHFQPQIVTEIILGPRTPKEDEKEILEIAVSRYPQAKLLRLKCDYAKGNMFLQPLHN